MICSMALVTMLLSKLEVTIFNWIISYYHPFHNSVIKKIDLSLTMSFICSNISFFVTLSLFQSIKSSVIISVIISSLNPAVSVKSQSINIYNLNFSPSIYSNLTYDKSISFMTSSGHSIFSNSFRVLLWNQLS